MKTLAEFIIAGEAFKKGIPEGYKNFQRGLRQSENEINEYFGALPEGASKQYTRAQDLERQQFANQGLNKYSPLASQAGQIVGETLPFTAMPIRGFGSAIAGGAVQGGLGYVPEGESRAERSLSGGIIGGATHGLLEGGSKGINALGGKFANPEEATKVALGEKYNVPLSFQDVAKEGILPEITGAAAERVPYFSKKVRKNQMNKAQEAARKFTNEQYQNMIDTPYNGIPEIKKAAENGDDAARITLENLNEAGKDWNEIMKASGNAKLIGNKIQTDKLYNEVDQIGNQYGRLNTDNIIDAIDNTIYQLKKKAEPPEGLIGSLETQRKNIMLNEDFNFQAGREYISDLKADVRDAAGKGLIGSKETPYLKKLTKSVEKELKSFAEMKDLVLKQKLETADKYYKKNVVPYMEGALGKALRGNSNADEIYSSFIMRTLDEEGKGGGKAVKFFNALDPKGQQAVRYGMVRSAYQAAHDPIAKTFDPAIFAGELDKIAPGKSIFFKGDARKEIEGFKNLMRYAEKSKPVGSGEISGNFLEALVKGALSFAGASPILLPLFTSKEGRNLLLAASKLEPGSEAFKKFLQKANTKKFIDNMNENIKAEEEKQPDLENISKENFRKLYKSNSSEPNFETMSKEEFRAWNDSQPKISAVESYLQEKNQQQ